jgi:TonB family protein
MKLPLRAVILAATLSFHANADLSQDFAQAFQAYQQSLQNGSRDDIISAANQAFALGGELYGAKHTNTAALAHNYGLALRETDAFSAVKLFEMAIEIYEQHYGVKAVELLDPLIEISRLQSNRKNALAILRRAANLANDKPAEQAGQIKLIVGQEYLEQQSRHASLLEEAHQVLSEALEPDDTLLIESKVYLAKYHIARKDYKDAVTLLNQNLAAFSGLDKTHPYEILTRSFLIHAYESLGQSEQATEHCQQIGAMQPWEDTQEQVPLFRLMPDYPYNAAATGKTGTVVLNIKVDKEGFVRDPEVTAQVGPSSFVQAIKDALKKWRYAPKFENGKPVEAETEVSFRFYMRG